MQYKMMMIKGIKINTTHRVYLITPEQYKIRNKFETFTQCETIFGWKIKKSNITGRYYLITDAIY